MPAFDQCPPLIDATRQHAMHRLAADAGGLAAGCHDRETDTPVRRGVTVRLLHQVWCATYRVLTAALRRAGSAPAGLLTA
jgi:hypothetical protein